MVSRFLRSVEHLDLLGFPVSLTLLPLTISWTVDGQWMNGSWPPSYCPGESRKIDQCIKCRLDHRNARHGSRPPCRVRSLGSTLRQHARDRSAVRQEQDRNVGVGDPRGWSRAAAASYDSTVA
jgi:hypothetical protein